MKYCALLKKDKNVKVCDARMPDSNSKVWLIKNSYNTTRFIFGDKACIISHAAKYAKPQIKNMI